MYRHRNSNTVLGLVKDMDNWRKFNEASLPEKEDFCSNLNMEDITAADYMHAKEFGKILK